MLRPPYSSEEVVRRGTEHYEQHIRSLVETGNIGKFLVIDVETGDYELGDNPSVLAHRLHEKREAAPLYSMKIGYPATVRIGGRLRAASS